MMYDAELTLHLWTVFPDAFRAVKTHNVTKRYAGPWGMEECETGETETEILAEDILCTAQAFSRCGNDMPAAHKYIDGFRPAWIQRRELSHGWTLMQDMGRENLRQTA